MCCSGCQNPSGLGVWKYVKMVSLLTGERFHKICGYQCQGSVSHSDTNGAPCWLQAGPGEDCVASRRVCPSRCFARGWQNVSISRLTVGGAKDCFLWTVCPSETQVARTTALFGPSQTLGAKWLFSLDHLP